MSSPQYQYVYIPNLVGRQMLRIPIEDMSAENTIPTTTTTTTPLSLNTTSTSSSSSSFSRETSPAPSVESVQETE